MEKFSICNQMVREHPKQKPTYTFAIFDIDSFYPSISETLLRNAINFAKQHTNISNLDIDIIMHCRKISPFPQKQRLDEEQLWQYIRRYNGKLGRGRGLRVGRAIHSRWPCQKIQERGQGLYRDDGLAVFNNTSGPQAERNRKDITRIFKKHGLKISIKTNLKVVNFLDVTFNLTDGTYYTHTESQMTRRYI